MADRVVIRPADAPSGAAATVYSDVKVESVEKGQITFTTLMGNSVVKDLTTVTELWLDDEPTYNAAQRDFLANRVDRATDEYDQVIQNTNKPWLKAMCYPRLAAAAQRAGRFDKAVEAYLVLLKSDPKTAAQYRPTVPEGPSPYLDAAAKKLSDAVDGPNLTGDQQTMLLTLLVEVQHARNDEKAVAALAARLPSGLAATGDPGATLAAGALADAKLAEAAAALSGKNFDKATAVINGAKSTFLDPARQAEALYILAQAQDGRAQASGQTDAWRDAAIAYLRVVGDFKSVSGAPRVADSLLRAAQIVQKLNQPAQALEIYQSLVNDFPTTPAADQARQQIDQLKSSSDPKGQ